MDKFQQVKKEKLEQSKIDNSKIRIYILLGIVLIGSLFVSTLLHKAKSPITQLINNEPTSNNEVDNKFIDFEHLFSKIDNFNLPNIFDKNTLNKQDNVISVKGSNDSLFEYIDGYVLNQDESNTFLINKINLYAKIFNEKINTRYKINKDTFFKLDEINTKSLTFYVYGFLDNGFYKYIAINVHNQNQKEMLSYIYLQVPTSYKDIYHDGNIDVEQHQKIIKYILKDLQY
jgi:hypothetical protein